MINNKNNKICVVGWHYFKELYKFLSVYYLDDVHIVAHRYNKILDKYKLNYTVIENIGLEFHAYDWYIKNIWDKKSNILFMHDDIKILKIKDFIIRNYNKIKKRKLGQAYISVKKVRGGGRCFYMSKRFIQLMKKEYDGIWYDKENTGYVSRKTQPEEWHPRRYNDGACKFEEMVAKLGEKYDIPVLFCVVDKDLVLYSRGKKIIKSTISQKGKKIQREKINAQKKKRKKLEKEWNKKFNKE